MNGENKLNDEGLLSQMAGRARVSCLYWRVAVLFGGDNGREVSAQVTIDKTFLRSASNGEQHNYDTHRAPLMTHITPQWRIQQGV
jgi:hypothetical protein